VIGDLEVLRRHARRMAKLPRGQGRPGSSRVSSFPGRDLAAGSWSARGLGRLVDGGQGAAIESRQVARSGIADGPRHVRNRQERGSFVRAVSDAAGDWLRAGSETRRSEVVADG
jgi:hypothetical protein